MRKLCGVAVFVLAAGLAACRSMAAGDDVVGAVLTLRAGDGVTAAQAAAMSDKLSDELGKSGACRVINRAAVQDSLARAGIQRSGYGSNQEFAFAAGRALKADYVVFGDVQAQGQSFAMNTQIAEVPGRRVTGTHASTAAGGWDAALAAAPREHVDALINATATAAPAAAAAPAPVAPAIAAAAPAAVPAPVAPVAPVAPEPIRLEDVGAAGALAAPAALPAPAAGGSEPELYDRLAIGARLSIYSLSTETRKTFLGSITEMETDMPVPLELYGQWIFAPFCRVEVAWNRLQAKAITSPHEFTDGEFSLNGPTVAGILQWPTDWMFCPYAGLGISYYSAKFEARDWWRLNYPSPQEWEAAGAPTDAPRGDTTQRIDCDDALGLTFLLGCEFQLTTSWSVDLRLRWSTLDVDVAHRMFRGGQELTGNLDETTIPFDHFAYSVGLTYMF